MQRNCSDYKKLSCQPHLQSVNQMPQVPSYAQQSEQADWSPLRNFLPRPGNQVNRPASRPNQQHLNQNHQESNPRPQLHQYRPTRNQCIRLFENVDKVNEPNRLTNRVQPTFSPAKQISSFGRKSIVLLPEEETSKIKRTMSQSLIMKRDCEQKDRGLKFLEIARKNRQRLEQKVNNPDPAPPLSPNEDIVRVKPESNCSPLMPLSHLKKMKKSYIMENNQGDFVAKREVISPAIKQGTYFRKKSMDCDWSPSEPLKIKLFETSEKSKPKPETPQTPLTLDDFEVIEKIGKGAFGDVSLAREKKTRFLCVLKALSKKKIKSLNLEEHVLREIKIQTYLSHRHITALYGCFDDQDRIYLVMEYMPDGAIPKSKKKISEPETAYYVRQVCLGLAYMHQENLIHRDIKPENLLTYESYIKIGDFGCVVFSQTLRETVVGCYAYISPEQLSHTPYDSKIDVWSVGILTYQLLYGRPPFEQELIKIAKEEASSRNTNHSETSSVQIDRNFPKLTFPAQFDISAEAKDFISMLLIESSEDRVQIRDALKHKFILKQRQWQKHLEKQAGIIQ